MALLQRRDPAGQGCQGRKLQGRRSHREGAETCTCFTAQLVMLIVVAGFPGVHDAPARANEGAVQGNAFSYPYPSDYGPVVSPQHDERRRGRLVCSPDPARSGLRLLATWRRCTIIEPEEGDERSRPECQPKTIANNLNTRTSLYRSPPLVML